MILKLSDLKIPYSIPAFFEKAGEQNGSLTSRFFIALGLDREKFGGNLIEGNSDKTFFSVAILDSMFESPTEYDLLKALLNSDNSYSRSLEEECGKKREECRILLENIFSKDEKKPNALLLFSDSSALFDATALNAYTENMSEYANEKKSKPVIGREREIDLIETVLLRKEKRNVFLTGESGVGKTAVVEGLIQKISQGKCHPLLQQCSVFSLDVTSLIGGASLVGTMEKRIGSLINEIKGRDEIILFIDEFHQTRGAGAASHSALDLGELLKKPLSRGQVRIIAATTSEEYERYVATNKALARRFQSIQIPELSSEETIEALSHYLPQLEGYYSLTIEDDVAEYCVTVTSEFVSDRKLPDKAIDLLDLSCSMALKKEKSRVTTLDVRETFSRAYNIPISRLTTSDREYFNNLADVLKEKIIGQDHAIKKTVDILKRGRLQLRDTKKPLGSLLFLGATGVGKTELARQIAANYFVKAPLVIFPMAEYKERHDTAKLLGSAPGLVGHEEGGKLTNVIKQNPNSIIVFDEIEKAHHSVFDICLSLFDQGEILDNKGERVSAHNCLFILTSNLASEEKLNQRKIGFQKKERDKEGEVIQLLKETFQVEFLNRLDEIVVFDSFTEETLKKVILKELKEYIYLLKSKNIIVKFDEERLVDYVIAKNKGTEFGARNIKRIIEKNIISSFTSLLLTEDNFEKEMHCEIRVREGEIELVKCEGYRIS